MAIIVEAIYENGVLKPSEPLPLKEHERVEVTIKPQSSWVEETAGIARWTGDVEQLRRLALAPEFDLEEEP
jgi:predicted DNA-binding antitoxin AbrB/MazE fold protein